MAESNSRDLILAPNQQGFVQDQTKGNLNVYVGSYKTSLAQTDQPVRFNAAKNRYEKCSLEESIFEFPRAPEGSYIILVNPARDDKKLHPPVGSTQQADLRDGSKVNIAGPAMFPLWPGQVATVIAGHKLRSNQYLLVEVYNEEEARANWAKTVVKPAAPKAEKTEKSDETGTESSAPAETQTTISAPTVNLTIGRQLVIKGSEVSFYIPPTGIEVLPDASGSYVRDAVTLERLEYCILLDESGDKRTVKGPKVVFPEPTQTFVEKDGKRKFRAIELNDDMGIYVKVIADYEEGGKKYAAGDELFITGKEQRIYYPREEHAIIKYGAQERHYGVVIPNGDGRYLLDKKSGKINLHRGPDILLCDPRKEVLIRRVLEDKQVCLWYPGNDEARRYNAKLRELVRGSIDGSPERGLQEATVAAAMPAVRNLAAANYAAQVDEFQRGTSHTPPRTLTLDSKYEGAVAINVWANNAVLVTSKTGGRRVEVGPSTVLLEYDEVLHTLELSSGKPKTADRLLQTCYLKVTNNQVTDILTVSTRDLVSIEVKLSYNVNFEGDDPEKWFAVDNYVKTLCDRIRSLLRHTAKQVSVEAFNNDSIRIIRDAILGTKGPEGTAERPGLLFKENNMRVCDVEVLTVKIGDDAVNQLLNSAQNKAVRGTLELASLEKELELARRRTQIEGELAQLRDGALASKQKLDEEQLKRDLELSLKRAASELTKLAEQAKISAKRREEAATENASELALAKAGEEQRLELAEQEQRQRIALIAAEVKAIADKATAISPQLIAALQGFADKYIAGEAAKAMGPMALLGGSSVAEVLGQLLKGTALESATKMLANGNGSAPHASSVRDGARS